MKPATLSVVLVLSLTACHEVPEAPSVTSPPPATALTITLDTITGPVLDVSDQWDKPTLFVGSDQSVHILAFNNWNGRERYHGCANECDDPAHWFGATSDTFATSSEYDYNSSSVLASDGFHAVRNAWYIYGYYGPTILYNFCPGACDLAANWSVAPLFLDRGWMPGDLGGGGQQLAADASGALHMLLFDGGLWTTYGAPASATTLQYARCAAACGDSANWRETVLDSSQVGLYDPKLIAVAPDGIVHIFYAKGATLIHASCAAGCATTTTWQSGAMPGITLLSGPGNRAQLAYLRTLSLAFGRGGTLDLAYEDGSGRVALATCAGPCSAPGIWSSATLPLVTSDVSLAASGAGTLYLATTDRHPAVSSCATDCLNPASWKTVPIPTALGGGASSFGGHVAVAVDSAGGVLLASTNGGGPQVLQYSRLLP